MVKDFDTWNEIKKKVDENGVELGLYFREREIWWGTLGLNIGVEADGKGNDFERPILIIKKFNAHMVWVLPLTGKPHDDSFHKKITHNTEDSWVCLTQIRTISTKRLLRKIWKIDERQFGAILIDLHEYL